MIDVQNLINNIKTITSKALCTWGEFATFLSTELQYFKEKGGITVNPPEVVLPDGVTTTTLISQSEMTQFVTNTLNVWIASINQGQEGNGKYKINDLLFPKFYTYNSALARDRVVTLDEELSVTFTPAYHNLICNRFNIPSDGFAPAHVVPTYIKSSEYPNGKKEMDSDWGYYQPIPLLDVNKIWLDNDNTAPIGLTSEFFRFSTDVLDEYESNIVNVMNNSVGLYEASSRYGIAINGHDDLIGKTYFFNPSGVGYVNKNSLLLTAERTDMTPSRNNTMAVVLAQITKSTPWYSSAVSSPEIKIVAVYPRIRSMEYKPTSPQTN